MTDTYQYRVRWRDGTCLRWKHVYRDTLERSLNMRDTVMALPENHDVAIHCRQVSGWISLDTPLATVNLRVEGASRYRREAQVLRSGNGVLVVLGEEETHDFYREFELYFSLATGRQLDAEQGNERQYAVLSLDLESVPP